MANIKNNFSDYIKFYLCSEKYKALLVENIIGWNEYGLDCARNLNYHGTLTQVTKTLGFTKEAKEYIEREFEEFGVLSKMSLIVERLVSEDGNLKWIQDYPVYADFYKKEIQDDVLTISFNSNNLMNKIESYEDEDFELERTQDVNNNEIQEFEKNEVVLEGRNIQEIGVSVQSDDYGEEEQDRSSENYSHWNPLTKIISNGPVYHSSVDVESDSSLTASRMFWVGDKTFQETTDESLRFKFGQLTVQVEIDAIFKRVENLTVSEAKNDERSYIRVRNHTNQIDSTGYWITNQNVGVTIKQLYDDVDENPTHLQIKRSFSNLGNIGNIEHYTGLSLEFPRAYSVIFNTLRIKVFFVPYRTPPTNAKFQFLHNTIDRILHIISGKKDILFSNILGKTEQGYNEDGELSLIGTVSGLQSRAFSEDSEYYTSPKISLKDVLQSISNTFNLGYGTELIKNKERLIVEDIRYFYRQEVLSRFPKQITNVKRTIDESSYYSGLEFGFEKGGDYENDMGLDEPNIKSAFTTPLNNTSNKFKKLSKIRADEYGLEVLRRKPESTHPIESLSGDEDHWYLDLKRDENDNTKFVQKSWSDRLSEAPTGIFDPGSFRSMFFTPFTTMRRFSNIFNSGIYLYKEKFVNFANSSSNQNLRMNFIDEENFYKENEDIQISQLKRPIFKNEKITFTHPYSEELRRMLFGKTKVVVNGVEREVPNFYFKFEWLNEKGNIERGYFLKYEYEDNPTFEFQLCNEEII